MYELTHVIVQKTRVSAVATLLGLALIFAPPLSRSAAAQPEKDGQTKGQYTAELISPRAGQVLVPGQVVRVEWKSQLPSVDPSMCETEIRLSLDGGKSFTWVTGERDPRVTFFDWTVPNTPCEAALLDIYFGCLGYYPETTSLQVRSPFVISATK
jgi:hypothetical protein